ncbi:hypothetical protein E1264_10420 [Actinomadura sp. KC216]|uniref:hypothetical protein n=1 Tax=Actinomadura sp. KC216 TaxID=2530370 RepID=UPI001047B8FF|nr:hypothetical protein [Actinomadura sp. KC216]TDB88727.1 hypothetical protein E1264_10420 [Actinomadura sp. KC216]
MAGRKGYLWLFGVVRLDLFRRLLADGRAGAAVVVAVEAIDTFRQAAAAGQAGTDVASQLLALSRELAQAHRPSEAAAAAQAAADVQG